MSLDVLRGCSVLEDVCFFVHKGLPPGGGEAKEAAPVCGNGFVSVADSVTTMTVVARGTVDGAPLLSSVHSPVLPVELYQDDGVVKMGSWSTRGSEDGLKNNNANVRRLYVQGGDDCHFGRICSGHAVVRRSR